MTNEVKLRPGWLKRDTQRAAERVAYWRSARMTDQAEAQAALDAVRQSVIDAAREFIACGTVLMMCDRGPCQRVVELGKTDPQAKLIAALENLDARLKALERPGPPYDAAYEQNHKQR